MTEPTIAERADDLAAQLQAVLNSLPAYSSSRPNLTVAAGISLARMVGDLARQVEKFDNARSVLLAHQGPYFSGVDMRCKCQLVVADAEDWAQHVARVWAGADR